MKQFYLLSASLLLVFFWFVPKENTDSTNSISISKKYRPNPKKIYLRQVKSRSLSKTDLNSANKVWQSPLAVNITAVKSVTVEGGGNPVPGGQLNYSVILSNISSLDNATGVVFEDILNSNLTLVAGTVKATPIAVNDSYNATGNVGINVPASSGLLVNDVSPDNTSMTVTAGTFTGSASGTFVIAADGSFTYINNPGFTGTETYTYTLNTSSGTTTATISVVVTNTIWFVKGDYTGGGSNGTLSKPFTNINSFQAINNASNTNSGEDGDVIYIYGGTYNTQAITLRNNQKFYGESSSSTFSALTGITAVSHSNSFPTTNSSSTTAIINTTSTPITLGSGNDVQGFSNISTTSATTMTGSAVGNLKVREVSIAASAGQALQITAGGALDVQFKSISAAGASKGISVNSSTGNFQVLGTGTTAGSGGTISNISNRGAEFISCTNITLRNMNFTNANTANLVAGSSLSSTDFSNANGGIVANNVSGLTLNKVSITESVQRGIAGHAVSSLSMTDCTINNAGDEVNEGAIAITNLSGTCTIMGSQITRANEHLIHIKNSSGNLNLTVSNSTISDTQTTPTNTASAVVGSGILAFSSGSSQTSITVNNCTLTKIGADGFKTDNTDNSLGIYNVSNCTIDPANVGGPISAGNDVGTAIEISSQLTSTVYVDIHDNQSLKARGGEIVTLAPAGSSTMHGKVRNNILSHNNSAGDLSACSCSAIRVLPQASASGRFSITGNTISNIQNGNAISVSSRNGVSPATRIDATISSNNIIMPTQTIGSGRNIFLESGNTSSSFNILCGNVTNNQNNGTQGINGLYRLSSFGSTNSTLYIQSTGTAAETAWNNNGNLQAATSLTASIRTGSNVIFGTSGPNVCLTPLDPPSNTFAATNDELKKEGLEQENIGSANLEEETYRVAKTMNDTDLKTQNSILKESRIGNIIISENENSVADLQAGETVTVNGSGSGFILPAGKSTTISFSATVSATPSTCAITNQASVSGSNFVTVNSNTTTTNVVIPVPTAVTTASAICLGQSVSLEATCASGTVQWYTTTAPSTLLGTGSPLSQSPTTSTTYTAKCKVGGCESAGTNSGLITVNELPVASPSSNSPVCSGNSLDLTSTSQTSYSWTGPNSFSSSIQNPSITNVTTAASGIYSLTVTNSNGCTASSTVSVTINELPVANPSSDSPKCTGATLAFNSEPGMSTYAWTGPNSFSSIIQNPEITSVTTAAGGTYSLTVTNSNGCTASSTVAVTINESPVANPSSDSPKCAGSTLAFNAEAGMSTYSWIGPNSFTSDIQNPTITNVTTAATGIYSITVTNSTGCTASSTISVTINELPVPNPSSDSPKCIGTTLAFNSEPGMSSYTWTGPNSFSSSIQNPEILNVTTDAAGIYSLTVTHSNGCTASSTVSVTINALPVPNPSSDSPKCSGSTLAFNSESGMSTYAWTGPNSFSSNIQNPTIANVTTAAEGTYSLTVTNSNGCSASSTVSVTLRESPIANPSSDSPKCAGTTLAFNSESGMSSYAWTGPNSFSSSIQNPEITNVSTAANGTYTLTVTNSNSCTASSTVMVTVNELPVPNPSSDSPKCIGSTLAFNSVSGMSTYSWIGPNSFNSNIQNPEIINITTAAAGTYSLTVTNSNGCSASATTQVSINTNISFTAINSDLNNVYACENGAAFIVLNNSFMGEPLNIQWQLDNGSGFSNITASSTYSKVNDDSLEVSNITSTMNNYRYRAIVSNACNSIVADTNTLKVNVLPTISNQPIGQTVCVGNQTTLSVLANGSGLSYQWQVNSGSGFSNMVNNLNYSGVNSSSLLITNIQNGFNNYQYRCVIFNQCLSINSNPATLVVDPTITILTQATNKTICQNANTTFNILAVNTLGGSISYQWQRFVGGTTWANLPNNSIYSGVTSSSLSITGAPANLTGLKYRCVINGYCQSEAVTLTVTPIATVINHPAPVTICVGNNTSFSVMAAGVNLTYRWQVNTGSGFVNIFDGGIYQGATSNTLLLDQPNATINGYLYRCVVTGNSSCDVTPAISNSAAINIGISAEAQTIVAVSPIGSGSTTYQAVQVVLGLNSITSPARVEYRAGNSILLNPGFLADTGSVFTAKIQNPCTTLGSRGNPGLPLEIQK